MNPDLHPLTQQPLDWSGYRDAAEAVLTTSAQGTVQLDVRLGDVGGVIDITGEIQAPIVQQFTNETGTAIGAPVTFPIDNYRRNTTSVRAVPVEMVMTLDASQASGLDWSSLQITLNEDTVIYDATAESVPTLNRFPGFMQVFIDGGEQLVWPSAELLEAGGFEQIKIVYSPSGQELQDGENQLNFNANVLAFDDQVIALADQQTYHFGEDTQNAQWAWGFTRHGLRVYYHIPGNTEERDGQVMEDIELASALAQGQQSVSDMATTEVRTLGGMRLRYQYLAPTGAGTEVERIEWQFAHAGRYCPEYGVSSDDCTEVAANEAYVQDVETGNLGDGSIYWEPVVDGSVAWSFWAGENTGDPGVAAQINARFTLPEWPNDPASSRITREYEHNFAVKTRELRPADEDEEPMQGSDVAMLEAMLWQLGLSPQRGARQLSGTINAGSSGARIHSHRGANRGWTRACGQAHDTERRDIYYSGWAECAVGHVSLEGMVRRFQARSFRQPPAGSNANNNFGDYAGWADQDSEGRADGVNGAVDVATLAQLGRVW